MGKLKRNVGVMMDFIKIIFTSLFSVITLFIVTKLMGHKQVAQLDFFDYVSGITIGSIGAEMATDLENPWKPMVALVLYAAVSILFTLVTKKSLWAGKYINGSPVVLFSGGKFYKENLVKSKLDLSEFLLLCRQKGFFDLSQIQTCVFELNGTLSILPKAQFRPVAPEDLELEVPENFISTELIIDGKVLKENLKNIGKNEIWLNKQMKNQGYHNAKDIFLGIYDHSLGSLSLYKKSKK